MSSTSDEYEVGNIFWAKVGSHPWWPCMIYYSPEDGSAYVRRKGRSLTYHVQFLGPLVERAWVSAVNLIPFMGKKAFDEYVEEKLRTCKDGERVKYDSKSVSSSRECWRESWQEAEEAMKLTPDERIEKFGRIAVKLKPRKFDKAEERQILQLMNTIPLTMEEEAESLANFLKDEIDIRSKISPELDKKCLEDELRTLWPALDIPTKRRYLKDQLGVFGGSLQMWR